MVLAQIGREALCEVVDEIEQAALAIAVQVFGGPGAADLVGLVPRHRIGQIAVNTTGAEVGGVHARAADRFVHVKQVFAFTECIQHHRHGAAIEGASANAQQVVEQTRNFAEHDTDVLGAYRHLDAQHLFHGQTVSALIAHHRHVVETVHVGQRLQIGLGFRQFFSGAVQQPDVRIRALNHFAVEFQHQTQNAVCGRMLRTEVEGVVFYFSHDLNA